MYFGNKLPKQTEDLLNSHKATPKQFLLHFFLSKSELSLLLDVDEGDFYGGGEGR